MIFSRYSATFQTRRYFFFSLHQRDPNRHDEPCQPKSRFDLMSISLNRTFNNSFLMSVLSFTCVGNGNEMKKFVPRLGVDKQIFVTVPRNQMKERTVKAKNLPLTLPWGCLLSVSLNSMFPAVSIKFQIDTN